MIISKQLLVEKNITQLTYEILKSQKCGRLTKKALFQLQMFCKKHIKIVFKNYNISIEENDFMFYFSCALTDCITRYKSYKYELTKMSEIYFMQSITHSVLKNALNQNLLNRNYLV